MTKNERTEFLMEFFFVLMHTALQIDKTITMDEDSIAAQYKVYEGFRDMLKVTLDEFDGFISEMKAKDEENKKNSKANFMKSFADTLFDPEIAKKFVDTMKPQKDKKDEINNPSE